MWSSTQMNVLSGKWNGMQFDNSQSLVLRFGDNRFIQKETLRGLLEKEIFTVMHLRFVVEKSNFDSIYASCICFVHATIARQSLNDDFKTSPVMHQPRKNWLHNKEIRFNKLMRSFEMLLRSCEIYSFFFLSIFLIGYNDVSIFLIVIFCVGSKQSRHSQVIGILKYYADYLLWA